MGAVCAAVGAEDFFFGGWGWLGFMGGREGGCVIGMFGKCFVLRGMRVKVIDVVFS